MKPVQPPDSHHLQAAIGWLELGNWQEANSELEMIGPEALSHPGVLEVRFAVLSEAKKWDVAAEVAHALNQMNPLEPQYWLWRAYAVRRMPGGGLPPAKEILSKAQPLFPKNPLIPYNLSCYECQLGNLPAAWNWLTKAMELGDTDKVKQMALADPDLEPFWVDLGETR